MSVGQSWQTAAVSESTRWREPGNSRASMGGDAVKVGALYQRRPAAICEGVKYFEGGSAMFRRFGHGEEPDFQGALSLGCCFEIPALTPTPLPEGEGQLQ